MQYDGQDMIGPFMESRRDEANEYKKNLTLLLCFDYADTKRTGGGRKRKDCVPVTAGVPPVSSATKDPFNLSMLP